MQLRKDAKVALIKRIPLFKHCSKKELGQIASIADELDLKDGAMLTREGKGGREFFVIVEGSADVLKDGKRVNTVHEGDFIGEISLVTGQPRTASVQATSPVRVLVITSRNFSKLLDGSPEIQRKILLATAERLSDATP
ncbi:MAG: cyclic nucleotide-binding domain-containing protein [Actinobacteria bacterium]|nr:MAG: cyclic nucleotide-binding domain-containing protein [Actinomycetota bacterium]